MSEEDTKSEEKPLPKAPEVLRELRRIPSNTVAKEERFEEALYERSIKGERAYVHLRGLIDHYRHKKIWSKWILGLMVFMVGFQSVLLGLVGADIWSFDKYTWLLPALLVQNLAQVVGLAVLVVKSLFRDVGQD